MSPTDRPKPPNTGYPPDGPDPDDPPTEEELRAAAVLQRVLDEPQTSESGERNIEAEARRARDLVQSIRAAVSPREISSAQNRQLIERALAGSGVQRASDAPRAARESIAAPDELRGARDGRGARGAKSKITYLVFGGAAGAIAMAAAVAMVIRGASESPSISASASVDREGSAFALSRSTADLFPEGIPRSGGTSNRVDRIAYARAQDFRQNQFARWGAQ